TFLINTSLALPAKAEQYVSHCRRKLLSARRFHPQDAAGIELDALARANHGNEGGGIDGSLRMKANSDLTSLPLDGRDAQALTHGFEDGVLQKVIHASWRRAEAVCKLLSNVELFFVVRNRGNALVGAQAEIFAGDVIVRDAHVEAQAERGSKLGRGLFTLEFRNGA